ncbi:hypothetical protein [Streptomyces sp. ISL-100]|uniref:hypothetical protein n=1 Tax=Streptomyces sp. ISL-100 TaxID=2819173 RepID=UPI001BEB0457|nr:hypothetical protein [Streptomyces sp. ISL-100]MBT2397953.1 hypothetical protein [Streptomyces sp. ISL-100]
MTATARTQSDEAADEAAATAGAPDKGDESAAVDIKKAADQDDVTVGGTEAADSLAEADGDADDYADDLDEAPRASSSGVGAGAAAVVSTVLGFAALTGTWTSRVAAERETLIGQLGTKQTDSPADQVAALYGNGWHMTALVNGGFALLALVVAVGVLARPLFGTPGTSEQSPWVRSFAWAGVALGVLGLLVSAGMYLDLFASMPTPPTAGTGAGAGQ